MGGRGLAFAHLLRIFAAADQMRTTPEAIAKAWGEDSLAEQLSAARDAALRGQKALGAGLASAGGTLVPEAFGSDVIEYLRTEAVLRKAGVRQISMPNGNLRLGRQSAPATAYWGSENKIITASQPSTDEVNLQAKKLTALVSISNDLIRQAGIDADQFVRDDLNAIMPLAEDQAFVRGDGTAGSPKGIRYSLASGNIFARAQASGSGSTVVEIQQDLMKAIRKLEENNVKVRSGFWLMNATTKNGLMGIRDTIANLVFAPEMRTGFLMGFPFYVTNQIPNNLGGGSDEGEVYFCEASEIVIGDHLALTVDLFPNGTYVDASGTMQSGISNDQSVLRALLQSDVVLRHNVGASVITTVDWPT
jgi:HK97 family phage major capsid protein